MNVILAAVKVGCAAAAILDAVIATGSRDKSLMVVDVILAADIAVATGSRDGAVLTEAGRWP